MMPTAPPWNVVYQQPAHGSKQVVFEAMAHDSTCDSPVGLGAPKPIPARLFWDSPEQSIHTGKRSPRRV